MSSTLLVGLTRKHEYRGRERLNCATLVQFLQEKVRHVTRRAFEWTDHALIVLTQDVGGRGYLSGIRLFLIRKTFPRLLEPQ
jgi:hypothetical protein